MRSFCPVPLGPRQPAIYPLPAPGDLPHSNPLPPRGNVLWLNSFSAKSNPDCPLYVFCLCRNHASPAKFEAHFLDWETEARRGEGTDVEVTAARNTARAP